MKPLGLRRKEPGLGAAEVARRAAEGLAVYETGDDSGDQRVNSR